MIVLTENEWRKHLEVLQKDKRITEFKYSESGRPMLPYQNTFAIFN